MKLLLPPQLKPLADQVRANPRLQLGLALILLLFLGWLFLVLGDLRNAQVQHLQQARQRYIQVRQLAGQQVWLQRAAEATQLAGALEAEIPPTRSPGLAQAGLQGWLKTIADSQGQALRLDMQPPVRLDAPADVVRVTATVAGSMEPQRVWQMIHRIEASTSLVTIPVLTVRSDGLNQTFSLTVQGYYRVPALAAPPAEATP
jgi:hypothetical protein